MKKLLEKIRILLRDRRSRRFLTRWVSVMAAIVVFVSTYAMILPAITLEKEASCGIEEHQHTEECYKKVLRCELPESEGHNHTEACYEIRAVLACEEAEHTHNESCYNENGELICGQKEHVHDETCYEEVKELTCTIPESEGHIHDDSCYEMVLDCDKQVHIHSTACYEGNETEDDQSTGELPGEGDDSNSAGGRDTSVGNDGDGASENPEDSLDQLPKADAAADTEATEAREEGTVPELAPLDMNSMLDRDTDFYYFHAEEDEEVPADSAEITDWQEVREDTELASTDIVKLYLAYSIPAGSLNETNPKARYRLPENIHLTDDQIKAINKNVNGVAAGYEESFEDYKKYLGAEAVEGNRKPDEILSGDAQEYIGAVVRAENVYDEEGIYGEKGAYLGQDLIFIFVPYSIEKNENTYDAEGTIIKAGEKITGWFACDFNLTQIDWVEEEIIPDDTVDTAADPVIEKTADIIFAAEDKEAEIGELSRSLRLMEQEEDEQDAEGEDAASNTIGTGESDSADAENGQNISEAEETGESDAESQHIFQDGTLTFDGSDYRIVLDYTVDAQIPEGAWLSVREITAETDKEAYEAYLAQAEQHMAESEEKTADVDADASRFFDIEIQAYEAFEEAAQETTEEAEQETAEKIVEKKKEEAAEKAAGENAEMAPGVRKIEPAAPVKVSIQILKAPETRTGKTQQDQDPTVLHFAEQGPEQMESSSEDTVVEDLNPESNTEAEDASDTVADFVSNAGSAGGEAKDIQFEAESFSVYGVVYTVDFSYEVNGKVYEFSLPGGGFVSLEALMELLHVASDSTQEESRDADVDNTGTSIDTLILNNDGISEETKKFVSDVESVVFSSTDLLWIGKVEEESTIGTLKEVNGLECRYSAELTQEQIEEINVQTVKAGDWALISIQAFESKETLTVTMKNGDVFTVRVTDDAEPPHVTIHFVDRDGNEIDGVSYTGENAYVTDNNDGTFSLPYDWNGATGSVYIDTEFSKSGYTYSSTHLAGKRQGVSYTYNGLTIDACLVEKSDGLYFNSDNGVECEDWTANPRPPQTGNLGYKALYGFNINNALRVPKVADGTNLRDGGGLTDYSPANASKDVYVILDPLPPSSSSDDDGDIDVPDPAFEKKLVSNGDGTYTLSLSVTGSGKNTETNPKANVIFIVDTSSSMRKNSSDPNSTASPTRLEDTKAVLADFSKNLLDNNTTGDNSDIIEAAMVTFDGGVVSSGWYTKYTGENGFQTEIDKLIPTNMHTGTDWEDALKEAYSLGQSKLSEGEATYIIFFTDGEPSQYTNFNGTGGWINGDSSGYRYWYSCFLSRETSKDEARAIVDSGIELFSIFAYNPVSETYEATDENGSDMLHNLTKYAYNNYNDLTGSRFYHAQSTEELIKAYAGILNVINEYVGIEDVEVNDNITSLTSVGVSVINGSYTGFKYTRSGGSYGTEEQIWAEAPHATYDSDGVHWDLSEAAVLETGVTYKVSFVVWPSQEAYDWVADLNNGKKTWDDLILAGLDDHFIRSGNPGEYRYEVATNPKSYNEDGSIANNLITYTKTHRETVSGLPDGVDVDVSYEVIDPITRTKTTTTYTQNTDNTYTKTVVTEVRTAFGPPDLNMGLTDTVSAVEKIWDVGEKKEELVTYLYDTSNGDSRNISLSFDVMKTDQTGDNTSSGTVYKTVDLGWKTVDGTSGYYWEDDNTEQVSVGGRTYEIGSVWREKFDIAVGLMLSEEMARARGIDIHDTDEERGSAGKYKKVYLDPDNKTSPYYVLEVGHDYDIEEPTVNYRFDFVTETSHPMLVNGVLKSVTIDYAQHKVLGITPEGNEEALSSLSAKNVLRGGLQLTKVLLDQDGNTVEDSDSVFQITVTLTNDSAPFYIGEDTDEENVPWYGVKRVVDGETKYCYFHKYENGNIVYVTEQEAAVNGHYDQYGLKTGYYGNIMEYDETDHKTARVTIDVVPGDEWSIANIPRDTIYHMTEASTPGYEFVSVQDTVSSPDSVTISGADISGTILSNQTANVVYTNQELKTIDITLVKVDVNNLNNDNPTSLVGAAFTIEKFSSLDPMSKDTSWKTNGSMTVTDSARTGRFNLTGLSVGYYKITEDVFPDGYIQTSDPPIFEVRKNVDTNALDIYLLEKGQDNTYTEVDDNNDGVVKITNASKTILVGNEAGAELPHTGGAGTRLIYLAGILITVFSAMGFLLRRAHVPK